MAGRSSFVRHEGRWVPREEWEAMRQAIHAAAIHRDFDAPMLCHADGKMHGSRSTYDAAVRSAGMEVIGKTEARRQMERGPFTGSPLGNMEPVADTLRRFANQ